MDIIAIISDLLNQVFNPIFNPIIALDPNPKNPLLTLFLIALIISVLTNLAQKYFMDHERMDELKTEISEFQNKMNAVRKSGDANAMNKLQSQQSDFMKAQSEMMMMSFKPMLVTWVPILLIFWWARSSVLGSVYIALPPFPYLATLTPIWHPIVAGSPDLNAIYMHIGYYLPHVVGFMWWYFLCSMALSQLVRKLVGLKSTF
jgi:uncharacterized membrane protein (DUF106 family)